MSKLICFLFILGTYIHNMKKNIFIISLTFILGLASCSFTSSNFDQTDKDKLLVQLISYVLDQGK